MNFSFIAVAITAFTFNYPAFSYDMNSINGLLNLKEKDVDVATVALNLEKELNPKLDVEKYSKKIDEIVGKIKSKVGNSKNASARVGAINDYIYKEIGLSYDLNDPTLRKESNRFMSGVFDTKKGSCITIPLLYIAVAQRLGYPIYPVIAPSHFFVRYVGKNKNINIETTSKGKIISNERYIKDFHVSKVALSTGAYMKELSYTEYLSELVLVNSIEHFFRKKEYEKGLSYIEVASKLRPITPEIFRAKGKMHFALYKMKQKSGEIAKSNEYLLVSNELKSKVKKMGFVKLSDKKYLKKIKKEKLNIAQLLKKGF